MRKQKVKIIFYNFYKHLQPTLLTFVHLCLYLLPSPLLTMNELLTLLAKANPLTYVSYLILSNTQEYCPGYSLLFLGASFFPTLQDHSYQHISSILNK